MTYAQLHKAAKARLAQAAIAADAKDHTQMRVSLLAMMINLAAMGGKVLDEDIEASVQWLIGE